MTRTIQLLKQVRTVTRNIDATSDNPEHKALLSVVDILLNELMLQDDVGAYLEIVKKGWVLMEEGQMLAEALHNPIKKSARNLYLGPNSRIETIDHELSNLFEALVRIIAVVDENRSPNEKEWLQRVTQWESSLYQRSLQQISADTTSQKHQITREKLQSYLVRRFPEWTGLNISHFEELSGGISKKTILFETVDELNGRQSLVMRAEQPVNLLHYDGSQVILEYYAICLMQQHGMPVAEPLWLEQDESQLGVRFIVSRKAVGSVIGGNFGSYEPLTPGQIDAFLTNLYKLHSIRLDPADPLVQKSHFHVWMPYQTVQQATGFYVNEYLPLLIVRAGIKTTPEMMRGLRWLQANVPECDDPAVVIHMDYAFNNMIFDGDRLSALLDWETSRLADPADDFTWSQPNLGVHDMAEFRQRYREGTGYDVSEFRIAYAALSKCLINLIAGRTALEFINNADNAPLHMGVMAYKFMPMLGANVDELIARAETVRGR